MKLTRRSMFTGIERTMELNITEDQFQLWAGGKNIQDAMPHLTDNEREFVMTGITPDEWDVIFSQDTE